MSERFNSFKRDVNQVHNHLMKNGVMYSGILGTVTLAGGVWKGDSLSFLSGLGVIIVSSGAGMVGIAEDLNPKNNSKK